MQPTGGKDNQLRDGSHQKVHPQPMEEATNQNPEAVELLISKIFTNISSLKSAYIQLQAAHTPYDPDKIQAADKRVISELNNLSELKHYYRENNPKPVCVSPQDSRLAAEIQEQQSLLKTYEVMVKKFQSEIQNKDSEILLVQQQISEANQKRTKLEKNLKLRGLSAKESEGLGEENGLFSMDLTPDLFGRYNEVRELFLDMKVSNTEPDAATYNILIQVFGEGGYFKEVVTLFHDMVEENVEPNMETYEGLIFACGKGGLYVDANKILLHMNEKGLVPSSKAYTGVIEAYGQAALYEEAIVAFNTMNEVGGKPTIDTFNSLIHAFARGGLYKESEAIFFRMGECGVPRNSDSFNGVIEGFRQGGQFEAAIKAYVEMEKARCYPDERTLEAVLSVYCFAGLVDESEEQFREITGSGILPSVMCYCMMLAIYAKSDRWDKARELLDEMLTHKVSNVHQVIGQMIKGDYDDNSNWQMVEYVFDKLNTEGCGLGLRFYNTLLEALWWLGQKERASRVLTEATKRGLFPELFRNNKLVWSVDVHRMWPGAACTAISVWMNNMPKILLSGDDLPQLATVVVVRGQMEKSSITRDFPIAKTAYSFLKDNISSSFVFPGWNKGRIVCQRLQLKRILSGRDSPSEGADTADIIALSNSPFPPERVTSPSNAQRGQHGGVDTETNNRMRTELVTSAV